MARGTRSGWGLGWGGAIREGTARGMDAVVLAARVRARTRIEEDGVQLCTVPVLLGTPSSTQTTWHGTLLGVRSFLRASTCPPPPSFVQAAPGGMGGDPVVSPKAAGKARGEVHCQAKGLSTRPQADYGLGGGGGLVICLEQRTG